MSEPPDLSQLAKRYVALWQDYMTATASDPELADTLARLIAGMGATMSPWLRAWSRVVGETAAASARSTGDGRSAEGSGHEPPPAAARGSAGEQATRGEAASRAAPVAVASHGRDLELAGLGRRLAAIEERLAALESSPGGRRPGPRSTARRRRS